MSIRHISLCGVRRGLPCASKLQADVGLARRRASKGLATGEAVRSRTFSKPKNLSLPSGRTGPASCSSFSRGVNCGAFGSFFAGGALEAGLWGYSGRTSAIARAGAARKGRGTHSPRLQAAKERSHGGGGCCRSVGNGRAGVGVGVGAEVDARGAGWCFYALRRAGRGWWWLSRAGRRPRRRQMCSIMGNDGGGERRRRETGQEGCLVRG